MVYHIACVYIYICVVKNTIEMHLSGMIVLSGFLAVWEYSKGRQECPQLDEKGCLFF